jgi:hypothetical protein
MAATIVYVIIRLTRPLNMQLKLVKKSKNRCAGGILALALTLTMPRARGRPRRGAGWYTVDSRRKRHKRFERALLLAKRKRRGEAIAISSPPRTYVKEDLSIELPPDFSERRLFIISDNWDPSTCLGEAAPPPSLKETRAPNDALNAEFDTCLVEEELSECTVDSLT